ncbi:pyruvate formate-lyase-activating protein [Rhodococcus sp. X156]|uniref:pyruvate formate-lyase-activating protein n=1 Tax=Rhodococcus sp. X156 TaxID=2499145 RepID=UPI000FD9D071|nr:pyruvate formate-lyase-activating protein [Rhodococcus sp. X156]
MTTAPVLLPDPVLPDHADELTGAVHSWDISTGVDGPGTRFVLFVAGCPLACAYCHNPDTQMMRSGTRHTVAETMDRIARYRTFLTTAGGGVTISGGEPLLQPAYTEAVLQRCTELGLHTALDTSGALGARASDALLDATDLVLLDVKAIDPALYTDLTTGQLEPTLRFAERLAARGQHVWVRFVLVPGVNDAPEHVRKLASYVASLGNVERVDVLGYHLLGREKYAALGKPDRLAGVPAATAAQVDSARQRFADAGLHAP